MERKDEKTLINFFKNYVSQECNSDLVCLCAFYDYIITKAPNDTFPKAYTCHYIEINAYKCKLS